MESGGVTLQEGRDYTIEKNGQTVTVKMTPEYIKANSSAEIIVTYNTTAYNYINFPLFSILFHFKIFMHSYHIIFCNIHFALIILHVFLVQQFFPYQRLKYYHNL